MKNHISLEYKQTLSMRYDLSQQDIPSIVKNNNSKRMLHYFSVVLNEPAVLHKMYLKYIFILVLLNAPIEVYRHHYWTTSFLSASDALKLKDVTQSTQEYFGRQIRQQSFQHKQSMWAPVTSLQKMNADSASLDHQLTNPTRTTPPLVCPT